MPKSEAGRPGSAGRPCQAEIPGRGAPARGSDLRYDLSVSLEQAYSGDQVEISLTVPSTCDSCQGNGARKGSSPKTCSQCGGYGKVRAQQGFFTIERTCPACSGVGETISDPCSACRGQGRLNKGKKLYDKRETKKRRDIEKDIKREMKRNR